MTAKYFCHIDQVDAQKQDILVNKKSGHGIASVFDEVSVAAEITDVAYS